jgi:hypothetical protein
MSSPHTSVQEDELVTPIADDGQACLHDAATEGDLAHVSPTVGAELATDWADFAMPSGCQQMSSACVAELHTACAGAQWPMAALAQASGGDMRFISWASLSEGRERTGEEGACACGP